MNVCVPVCGAELEAVLRFVDKSQEFGVEILHIFKNGVNFAAKQGYKFSFRHALLILFIDVMSQLKRGNLFTVLD